MSNSADERLSHYEKYHLHDHVYTMKEMDNKILPIENSIGLLETDVESIETMVNTLEAKTEAIELRIGEINKRKFYKGHCKHNNNKNVRFHPNSDVINHSANVTQSKDDFVVSPNNNRRLLIVNHGLYVLTYTDALKCSKTCNLRIKLSKVPISLNNNNFFIQKSFPTTSSWTTISFTTVLDIEDNTHLEMYVDESSALLDGQGYSWITLYRLTE